MTSYLKGTLTGSLWISDWFAWDVAQGSGANGAKPIKAATFLPLELSLVMWVEVLVGSTYKGCLCLQ